MVSIMSIFKTTGFLSDNITILEVSTSVLTWYFIYSQNWKLTDRQSLSVSLNTYSVFDKNLLEIWTRYLICALFLLYNICEYVKDLQFARICAIKVKIIDFLSSPDKRLAHIILK